ncbi:hypothetical protein [Pseudoalteromonas denitrificans]|uniref:Uncharacterized protein n=1 Tax=Pseudoalteromonas denitrificans DSM 6059 TaxID=1123010 RepID=A0A1I1V0D2_9GAMM|nr:hypothetical protein [Pseudoalteromonas denitrificans]SFD75448.1 hypothetical protein SAMN02745724_05362 [Pseudoalteromonas denitrificans DSM 6059]
MTKFTINLKAKLKAIAMISCILFGFLLNSYNTFASKIDARLWEQHTLQSDLIAVIECTLAGGSVTEFKIINIIKGDEKLHSNIRIKNNVSYWGRQFNPTLVGERFLITGFKNNAPVDIYSMSSGGAVPLWWRNLAYDYKIPLGSGFLAIKEYNQQNSYHLPRWQDKPVTSTDELIIYIKSLLNKSAQEQDLQILHSLIQKYMAYDWHHTTKEEQDLAKELLLVTDPLQIIRKMWLFMNQDIESRRYNILRIFEQGPFSQHLQKNIDNYFQELKTHNYDWLQYHSFYFKDAQEVTTQHSAISNIDKEQIQYFQKYLNLYSENDKNYGKQELWYKAFTHFRKHEPIYLSQYLSKWTPTSPDWNDKAKGYEFASSLIFNTKDLKIKRQVINKLLNSVDPHVRVTASVYLTIYNKEQGEKELAKNLKLNNGAGLYAALSYARRGHKLGVNRALELIKLLPTEYREAGNFIINLKRRLLVLLSNSAKSSNLPQPPTESLQTTYKSALNGSAGEQDIFAWWVSYKDEIKLLDPWLAGLDKQGID